MGILICILYSYCKIIKEDVVNGYKSNLTLIILKVHYWKIGGVFPKINGSSSCYYVMQHNTTGLIINQSKDPNK